MSKPIIEVTSLSKSYTIGAKEAYGSLRDEIMQTFTVPFKRLARLTKPYDPNPMPSDTTIWALKDVSFEVQEGEVIGIIGRNGAGKSTLLKILSRITEPTSGKIVMHGRVASLLEVGTGFHPELTGRENIFLNGALLGMSRQEIKTKFDEIVAFSEIEKFLDTPVKRYSSGMYVRLAFAVAAHLEPEIFIVDEVLAVGDAQFQKKCLGKMGEVAKGGRTVLFVSHNMAAISNLCSKIVLLKKGSIEFIGNVAEGIDKYLSNTAQNKKVEFDDLSNHVGALAFSRFTNVETFNSQNEQTTEFKIGEGIKIKSEFILHENISNLELGFCIHNLLGTRFSYFIGEWEGLPTKFSKGRHEIFCEIPSLFCLPGMYGLTPWIKRKGEGVDDQIDFAVQFSIIGNNITGYHPDFERYPITGVYQFSKWKVDN